MRHREAIDYLPDLGSGLLDSETQANVRAHVDDCPACRDWLATHDLLLGALSQGQLRDDDHPSSEVLALCVVRPEELREPGREELRDHLVRCSTCREAVALVGNVVHQARPGEEGARPPIASRSRRPLYRSRLLAAGLAILVLGSGLLFGALVLSRFGPDPMSSAPRGSVYEATNFSEATDELSGQDLEGHRVIETERTLVVSKLTVKSGADVTLRARGVVAFGDGFQVARGARLSVGAGTASGHAPSHVKDGDATQ